MQSLKSRNVIATIRDSCTCVASAFLQMAVSSSINRLAPHLNFDCWACALIKLNQLRCLWSGGEVEGIFPLKLWASPVHLYTMCKLSSIMHAAILGEVIHPHSHNSKPLHVWMILCPPAFCCTQIVCNDTQVWGRVVVMVVNMYSYNTISYHCVEH